MGRLFVALATLGPIGRKLPAPGTWGSVAGLLYFTVFFWRASWPEVLVASVIGAALAAFVCGAAEVFLGKKDPGSIILDEFISVPLCFLGWSTLLTRWPPWAVLLAGFALFRVYDIAKPFGIKRLQRIPGGWGVVADDLVAALCTCATLHVLVRLLAVR